MVVELSVVFFFLMVGAGCGDFVYFAHSSESSRVSRKFENWSMRWGPIYRMIPVYTYIYT
jgi:DMSO reductase anchor subunit